jgi:hypothetical protein
MGIFKKKVDKETKELLRQIDGKLIEYCSERDNVSYIETLLGKSGRINVASDEVVILCDAHEVFRGDISSVQGGEFLSHEGVTLSAIDKNTGVRRSIMAYYKYYRK